MDKILEACCEVVKVYDDKAEVIMNIKGEKVRQILEKSEIPKDKKKFKYIVKISEDLGLYSEVI